MSQGFTRSEGFASLSDDDPVAPGVVSSGTANLASRSDHVHPGLLSSRIILSGGDQTIPNSSGTNLAFDATDFDELGIISLPTPVINIAGIYLITCGIHWTSNTTGIRSMLVFDSVSGDRYLSNRQGAISGALDQAASTIVELGVGVTLRVSVFQTSGGNLNLLSDFPLNFLTLTLIP